MYHSRVIPAVAAYIRQHALFRPGERVGVAVSGGADSVALLRTLLELRSELGIVLGVVHLNHGIRGEEADADAQFVAGLAHQFDLPLTTKHVDVTARQRRDKLSLETAARNVRYDFFKRLLESRAFDKIATAHTRDDQAETVLLRVLRGTGTRGLAAIPPFRNVSLALAARIVRPLLAISRRQVEEYLHSIQQSWCEDASNADQHHLRNRVRHELLPLLESKYNPALRQSLVNLAEIARAEEAHWTTEVAALHALVSRSDGNIQISRPELLAVSVALQRRLLVSLADELDLPIGFEDVERILHIAAHPGTQHTFEGGWNIRSSKLVLEIRKSLTPAEESPYDLSLSVPGCVRIPNAVTVRTVLLPADGAAELPAGSLLSMERLQLPLRVRNWQPGDRFFPDGSKQEEKLKRLFQEKRVPAEQRASWPVVLSGATIVWVRGFPVAREYRWQQGPAILVEVQE